MPAHENQVAAATLTALILDVDQADFGRKPLAVRAEIVLQLQDAIYQKLNGGKEDALFDAIARVEAKLKAK